MLTCRSRGRRRSTLISHHWLVSDSLQYAAIDWALPVSRLLKIERTPNPIWKLQVSLFAPRVTLVNVRRQALLAAVQAIHESFTKLQLGPKHVLGADDFLPIFIFILKETVCHYTVSRLANIKRILQKMEYAEVEAEYMWALLDPSVLASEVRIHDMGVSQ